MTIKCDTASHVLLSGVRVCVCVCGGEATDRQANSFATGQSANTANIPLRHSGRGHRGAGNCWITSHWPHPLHKQPVISTGVAMALSSSGTAACEPVSHLHTAMICESRFALQHRGRAVPLTLPTLLCLFKK